MERRLLLGCKKIPSVAENDEELNCMYIYIYGKRERKRERDGVGRETRPGEAHIVLIGNPGYRGVS